MSNLKSNQVPRPQNAFMPGGMHCDQPNSPRTSLIPWLVTLLIFAATTGKLHAQTDQITGVITDSVGATIPQANVQITDKKAGTLVRESKSGPDGTFRALNMPPATYSIRVSASGMENLVRNDITLDEQQTLSLGNLGLKVGGGSETVTVTEEAPLIETANSDNSAIVDQRQVTEQPLDGRDFESLLTTLPGIVTNNTSQFRLVFNVRPRKSLGWKAPAELFLPDGAFDFVKHWSTTINHVALGA